MANKDEIKTQLTDLGIVFTEEATKAELEALLPASPVVPAKESDAKKAYKNLIEVYKAKNPAKYETKKAELQRKLDAIA